MRRSMIYIDLPFFGRRLRRDRRAIECTLAQLGKEVGLSTAFLCAIEKNRVKTISASAFMSLCDWLGLSPHYFTQGRSTKKGVKRGRVRR